MKIYPAPRGGKHVKKAGKVLNRTERITKAIAMIAAFVTIYYFFLKILFF